MPRGDVSKLPKWAQTEIQRLERNLESANARLNTGPEDSDTFADPYFEESTRPLGRGTMIQFGEERGRRFRVRIDKDGRLDVSGDEGLIVIPRASNSILLESRRY